MKQYAIYGPLCCGFWNDEVPYWTNRRNATLFPTEEAANKVISQRKLGFDARPYPLAQ